MNNHLVLIGLNYQPVKSTGDKNFWIELIKVLSKEIKYITIFSVRKNSISSEVINLNGCRIEIRYFSPKLIETPDAEYKRKKIFWKKGRFPSFFAVFEKLFDIKSIIKELRNMKIPATHIHLMDNFGIANRILSEEAHKSTTSISVSAMAYQGKNPFFYHRYLKLSYKVNNLTVVPYSAAYKDKLIELGLKKTHVNHIHWGTISDNNFSGNTDVKIISKRNSGLPSDKVLFLWAGYLQQIHKNDFLYAYKTAEIALGKGLNAVFYFAFKPESFSEKFCKYNKQNMGIYVQPTGVEQFLCLKNAADIFYSPVLNKKCIVAPPFTWIEVMSMGVPVLTTAVPGVNEIIEDSYTGYIAENENDIIQKMFLINENFSKMSGFCKQKIKKDYNIDMISKKYLELWFNGNE